MQEDQESPVKVFHQKSLDIKAYNCLICGKRAGKAGLRSPKEQGVTSFISALSIRKECNGVRIEQFEGNIDFVNKIWRKDIGSVKWHAKCYATYTNSRNLEFLCERSVDDETINLPSTSTRSKTPCIDLKSMCMFCGNKKRQNDTHLVEIQYQDVLERLEKRCKEKNDKAFETRIGGNFSNLPALEAKYHSSCYKLYMKENKRQSESSVHEKCFQLLTQYIDPLLADGRALSTKDLLETFKLYLRENEYDSYDSYTQQKLRNRIIKHYGSRVCITNEANKSLCIYDSKTSLADVINIAATHKRMLKDKEIIEDIHTSDEKILKRAVEILKRDISDITSISIHPLNPEDICHENIVNLVPSNLKLFLNLLCNTTPQKEIKMLAIAQDIITLHSNGRKRMPKNVGLALSLKNSIRSKEFITYLNNLGHCISYDDVLRIDTNWASGIIENGDGYATIPSNIKHNAFTQAASDNGDYGQENCSQHVTNTVLYQYGCTGTFNRSTAEITTRKKHRRSISLPQVPMDMLETQIKPHIPSYYSEITADIFKEETSNDRILSTNLTTSWILLRNTGNKLFSVEFCQNVPPWTGFRKVVSLKVSSPTIIGNCRTIPASPTDINVIYTMMKNVKQMLVNLGQKDPCITVDESIYELAKQVQWLIPDLDDITIRLGGFHRAKNFMGVIGKRMNSTGLGEILVSANLYGPNQVEGKIFFR